MILELVATLIVGLCGWGAGMLAIRLSGRRLPKWIGPALAGAAMLGFTIFNEYAWFRGVRANLPAQTEVALTVSESKLYRPWTYIWPQVTRFIALDHATATRPAPGQVMVDLYALARWQPGATIPVLFDCDTPRRADFPTGRPDPDVEIPDEIWVTVEPDDPIRALACEGPSP